MENYCEYLIKKKFSSSDLTKAGVIILALMFICVSVSLWLGVASALVILAFGGYGAWFLISGLKKEFEYVLTNDHLDVDEITAQRSRKRLCKFDIDTLEIIAAVNNADKNSEMKRTFAKTFDARSEKNAENAYFAVFSDEEGLKLLLFEPNEKILDGLRMYSRSKIFK